MRTGLSSSSVPRKPSLQWIIELGPMVASPVFDNNTIYSATITGRIYALQKYQRQIKWHSNIGSPIVSSPLLQKDLLIAATFDSWVKDTKGFLGKNLVFALNAKTGEEVWVFDIDGDVFSSPCVAQEMIIIGSMNKILFRISSGVIGPCPCVASGRRPGTGGSRSAGWSRWRPCGPRPARRPGRAR